VLHPEDVRVQVGYDAALERHRRPHQRRLVAEIFGDDRLDVETLCSCPPDGFMDGLISWAFIS